MIKDGVSVQWDVTGGFRMEAIAFSNGGHIIWQKKVQRRKFLFCKLSV